MGGKVLAGARVGFWLALAVAAAALATLVWYMVAMPGRSWSGALPALTDEDRGLSSRLGGRQAHEDRHRSEMGRSVESDDAHSCEGFSRAGGMPGRREVDFRETLRES